MPGGLSKTPRSSSRATGSSPLDGLPDVQVPAKRIDRGSAVHDPAAGTDRRSRSPHAGRKSRGECARDAGCRIHDSAGSRRRGYGNVRLRDAIKEGRVQGPRVVASGPWLGISGGICDFNGIGVRGEEAFRQRVRDDVEHGADLIKVCVTGWLAEAVESPVEVPDQRCRAERRHWRGPPAWQARRRSRVERSGHRCRRASRCGSGRSRGVPLAPDS